MQVPAANTVSPLRVDVTDILIQFKFLATDCPLLLSLILYQLQCVLVHRRYTFLIADYLRHCSEEMNRVLAEL